MTSMKCVSCGISFFSPRGMTNVLGAQEKNLMGMEDTTHAAAVTAIRIFLQKYQAYIKH